MLKPGDGHERERERAKGERRRSEREIGRGSMPWFQERSEIFREKTPSAKEIEKDLKFLGQKHKAMGTRSPSLVVLDCHHHLQHHVVANRPVGFLQVHFTSNNLIAGYELIILFLHIKTKKKSPPKSMGKRKIEMKKIEKKSARQVCFSKRRQILFKKAKELSILCGVDRAVLTFFPAGRLFSFANTDIDSILGRYCKEELPIQRRGASTAAGTAWRGERESSFTNRGVVVFVVVGSIIVSSSNLTKCTAADVKWPSTLDFFSQSSLGDESAANAMHTTYVEPPPLHLPHDGVMQVDSFSLDFAKDDVVLMMPSFEEDYENGLMKSIFEEVDDELMLMSMISRPSTETSFDDMFPPLNIQFGSF
ncbi:Agamous-like MADS-box protein AGL61 [Cinnamomum micranthum f. kanehirae]|uniref:Agamous-like MADS-box protein AGL61 n=1 Tax=Cinnamomum micranthum f. kanehirae TaxID=337451 RepID=A0A443P9E9_9MAGN|nr:Agamous-like MADS-box protein AGL61 [Cinnamomum micranthum f. kanehirae]